MMSLITEQSSFFFLIVQCSVMTGIEFGTDRYLCRTGIKDEKANNLSVQSQVTPGYIIRSGDNYGISGSPKRLTRWPLTWLEQHVINYRRVSVS
jgi:hypothetical protein